MVLVRCTHIGMNQAAPKSRMPLFLNPTAGEVAWRARLIGYDPSDQTCPGRVRLKSWGRVLQSDISRVGWACLTIRRSSLSSYPSQTTVFAKD